MLKFSAIIDKYDSKGEKTGWTYVSIPADILRKLKLKDKKAFRIKGKIDNVSFEKMSTYPMGQGEYIIAIKAELRKKLGKKEGAMVAVSMALDSSEALVSKELMACLKEDPMAYKAFTSQLPSHQNYFHRYIESAKTPATKAGRIVHTIQAMHKKLNYGEMIRSLNSKNKKPGD